MCLICAMAVSSWFKTNPSYLNSQSLNRRHQRLAREMRVQIRKKRRSRCSLRLRCTPGNVGCDNDVIKLKKLAKLRRHVRLAFEHIEAGAGDLFRFESLDERLGVHDRSAADVDQITSGPECREN